MNKKYNILFVARDDGGCGFYRCEQPAKFLKRAGLAEAIYVLREPTEEQLMNADLVIMQNMGSTEASAQANFLRKNNIPFITEFDDFIFHVSPHNLAGYSAWNPATLFIHRSAEMAKNCFGMSVSTRQLAREFFPYNPNIYVVPNYLDKDRWDVPIARRGDGKIRIGWAGGNAHADDLFMVAKVLEKIVKEYEGKVVFETMGMTRQELLGVFNMKIFNDNCPSCGYEGEIHHHPGESLNDYPLVMGSKSWDIALAPVINNSFGNCKSNLKILEYAALGLPIVASPVQPYKEAAESNAQIHFAESFEDWYNKIKSLIEDPSLRAEDGRKNKEWVQDYWIQENISNIFEVYKEIIENAEKVFGSKESRLKLIK